jgi:ABC-type thiamin/hydroxymethylpyrimidine transport system permease subunit
VRGIGIDTVKSVASAATAMGAVFYGMWQIFRMIELGLISPDAGLAILGPIIALAANWVLQRDSQTQAVRAVERAVNQGARAQAGVLPDPQQGS